jgi:hypothetical protein
MEDKNQHQPKRRPELLTAFCILSFIGSGMGALVYSMYGLFFPAMRQMFESGEMNFPGLDILMTGGQQYFITGAVLFSASLAGVVFMWKLKSIGFHLYAGAQILLLLLPVLLLKDYPFPYIDGLLTLAFILAYRFYLKFMD